jgi:hypothetical protein
MSPRQPLVDGARVFLARGFASKSAIHREVSHREKIQSVGQSEAGVMNEPITATVRLVVTPEDCRDNRHTKAGKFTACLESTGETIVQGTRQPLVDGARELLARGFDSATPLTMRHAGSAHDSFAPRPIAEWAKWTYTESEKHALKRQRWMPLPADREGQKSGSEPSVAPEARETENRFHGGGYPEPISLLGRVA